MDVRRPPRASVEVRKKGDGPGRRRRQGQLAVRPQRAPRRVQRRATSRACAASVRRRLHRRLSARSAAPPQRAGWMRHRRSRLCARARESVGAQVRARARGRSRRASGARGAKGRITPDDVKAFVKQALTRGAAAAAGGGGAAAGPDGRLREVRPGRASSRSAHPEDLRAAPAGELGQHPARHAARRSRHHRARRDARHAQGRRRASAGIKLTPLAFIMRACVQALAKFPMFNARSTRGPEPRLQEVRAHRLRRRHAERPGRAGDPRRRQEGCLRARARARRALGEGARRQAAARRHAGRLLHRSRAWAASAAPRSRRSSMRPKSRSSACRARACSRCIRTAGVRAAPDAAAVARRTITASSTARRPCASRRSSPRLLADRAGDCWRRCREPSSKRRRGHVPDSAISRTSPSSTCSSRPATRSSSRRR